MLYKKLIFLCIIFKELLHKIVLKNKIIIIIIKNLIFLQYLCSKLKISYIYL